MSGSRCMQWLSILMVFPTRDGTAIANIGDKGIMCKIKDYYINLMCEAGPRKAQQLPVCILLHAILGLL